MSDQYVCVAAGGTPRVDHDLGQDDRPACQIGNRGAGEFRVRHMSQLLSSVRYCEFCADREIPKENVGPKRATRLGEMDPEDLGLSPMGDKA